MKDRFKQVLPFPKVIAAIRVFQQRNSDLRLSDGLADRTRQSCWSVREADPCTWWGADGERQHAWENKKLLTDTLEGKEVKLDSRQKVRENLRAEEECLKHEVMSWSDGLFKLPINLLHKKDLNYIKEFGSDGRRLRPGQDWDQSNQVKSTQYPNRQSSLFTVVKNNV